ncbi:unnamed protein product, partial [Amoebophrya sp. A25]
VAGVKLFIRRNAANCTAELWKTSEYTLFTLWDGAVEVFYLPPDAVSSVSVACLCVDFLLTAASVRMQRSIQKLTTGTVMVRNRAARNEQG